MRLYVMLLNSAKFYDIQHLSTQALKQEAFRSVPPVNIQSLLHLSLQALAPSLTLSLETVLSLETFLLSENKFITFCKPNPLDVILYNTYILKFPKHISIVLKVSKYITHTK